MMEMEKIGLRLPKIVECKNIAKLHLISGKTPAIYKIFCGANVGKI